MRKIRLLPATFIGLVFSSLLWAQDDMTALYERGEALYTEPTACILCHAGNGEGGVGPNLQYGPIPSVIQTKLDTVPVMEYVKAAMNASFDDLIALSIYISSFGSNSVSEEDVADWRSELEILAAQNVKKVEFPLTERDQKIMEIMSFESVQQDWIRRAREGSLRRDYQVETIETYEAGEVLFTPEPGKLYFYENTGTGSNFIPRGETRADTSQVVVGDATNKTIITSAQIPIDLRGAVHTTVMSPDGRFVYIVGPNMRRPMEDNPHMTLRTPATLLKVDAFTLQPVKQMTVGGRVHHGQLFRDKYILFDTFNTDPNGLDVFLFDPETDQVIGGISTVDLGGSNYTAYTDDEFIYVLMQPGSDGGGLLGAMRAASGENLADLPYWVSKIDPDTWEVVAEYPFAGYRGNWILLDSSSENIYVPAAGSSNVTKIDNTTGDIVWSAPSGTGPYGSSLTADESELWLSNKGEGTGFIGRTITVIDAETGIPKETLFSGYQSDHILLSPNGKEMWVTSNGEGRILVFDVETREQTHSIEMPGFGDPHGLVFVKYDEEGNGLVVRDQGGFHNGINPALGNPLLD